MRDNGTQRRLGVGLMATTVMGAMVLAGPAVAQEPTETTTPVQATALLTYPANDALPDTALSGVPPQVVCVIEPQVCPEELEPVRDPIAGALSEVDANQQTSPLQPANPDGLTMTFAGGTPRYASAVKVQLPEVPAGEQVDEFVVTFPQGQPSYSVASPVFRRAVSAVIQTAGSQEPAVFQEQLAKALEEEPLTQPPMGIEACPLTVAIPEDAVAPQSKPIRSVSEENADGVMEPAVDCLYGTNGAFEDGRWSFDLTFAAQAWADGSLPDHGILLRPTGAPNLAFGDPDTSTNAQVVLDVSEDPTATFATSEPPPTPAPLAAPPAAPPASSSSVSSGTSAPPSSQMFSAPAPSGGGTTPQTPPAEVAPPQTAPAEPQPQDVALEATPAAAPSSGPWAWLLLPVFLAGAWLTARSLTEEVVVVGTRRGGALTRLVELDAAR